MDWALYALPSYSRTSLNSMLIACAALEIMRVRLSTDAVQVNYDRRVVMAALTFVKELRSAKGKALATERPRLVQVNPSCIVAQACAHCSG